MSRCVVFNGFFQFRFPRTCGDEPWYGYLLDVPVSFPRTCGDEPAELEELKATLPFSPHLRG